MLRVTHGLPVHVRFGLLEGHITLVPAPTAQLLLGRDFQELFQITVIFQAVNDTLHPLPVVGTPVPCLPFVPAGLRRPLKEAVAASP